MKRKCGREEFRRGGYTQFSDVTERSAARSLSETFGVVYDLSDRHAVGFTVRARLDGRDNASVASICREIAGNTESNAFGEYAYDGEMLLPQYQAAFNYTFDIDTLGSQFAVKADYMHTASKRRTDYRSVPSAGTGGDLSGIPCAVCRCAGYPHRYGQIFRVGRFAERRGKILPNRCTARPTKRGYDGRRVDAESGNIHVLRQ